VEKPVLEFLPGIGVGPVRFGMSPDEVIAVLESVSLHPSNAKRSSRMFFAQNAFQVEFTENQVSHIGVADSKFFEVRVYGANPFTMTAEEVFALITRFESNRNEFSPLECLFPDSIITLWDADEQYNHFDESGRSAWASVGLGNNVYWQQIQSRKKI
jgi:hypothetical protein